MAPPCCAGQTRVSSSPPTWIRADPILQTTSSSYYRPGGSSAPSRDLPSRRVLPRHVRHITRVDAHHRPLQKERGDLEGRSRHAPFPEFRGELFKARERLLRQRQEPALGPRRIGSAPAARGGPEPRADLGNQLERAQVPARRLDRAPPLRPNTTTMNVSGLHDVPRRSRGFRDRPLVCRFGGTERHPQFSRGHRQPRLAPAHLRRRAASPTLRSRSC